MKAYIESRVKEVASYILATHSTIRQTAKSLKISKSTVALDIERLAEVNPLLLNEVRAIVEDNKAVRHIRGGLSTKLKYMRS